MYKLETNYKCDTCGDEFMKKKKYKNHLLHHADFLNVNNMHHHGKTKICQPIETTFQDAGWSTHKDDTISVNHETIYKCRICGEEFWKKKKYKFHSQTHADKPNLEAIHHMDETNEHKQLQNKHDLVVQFEGELTSIECTNAYKCNQCFASFSTQKKLKLHLLTHIYTTNVQSDNSASKSEEMKIDLNGSEDLRTCSVCTMVFESCEHLANHNCSGKKLFQCTICKKGLASKHNLKVHFLTHSDTYEYQCDVCLKYFERRDNVKIHSTLHTGEKLFICDICDKDFQLQEYLARHVVHHGNKKLHHCNVCSKSFITKHRLTCHKCIHMNIRYKCDKCDLAFIENKQMQLHARTHSGPNPYVCRTCYALFSQRDQLDQHKLMLHQEIKNNLYKCDKCYAVLKNWKTYKDHLQTHSKKRPFECSKCGATYKRKPDLNQHLLHSKSCGSFFKEHHNSHAKCDMCGGSFATMDKLEVHILTHSEWPYKCDLCLKVFGTFSMLADHRKNHTLYRCDICGVDFVGINFFKSHRLEHKPVKAFQCKCCQSLFTTQLDLRCHSKIHKVVKPFQCDLCIKGYLNKHSLEKHYQSHFSGPRRYKCNWCGDKFRHISYLDEHLRKQHVK